MVTIGKRNLLPVSRDSAHGIFLDAGELGEILLPGPIAAEGFEEGKMIDVFIYRDSEDRLVATLDAPKAMAGEFASLAVVSVNRQIGAFLDWGLPKDLLLPFREQREPVMPGEKVVVYIDLDVKSDRLIATTRLNRHLQRTPAKYDVAAAVQILVAGRTPLGYSAIVENTHFGLLYHANLAGPLELGQRLTAYVSALRPDGKIDLRLDPAGYHRVPSLAEKILERLAATDGFLPLDDSSGSDEIREAFGASKKAFKQALGALYKKRRISFENPGIRLLEKAAPKSRPKK